MSKKTTSTPASATKPTGTSRDLITVITPFYNSATTLERCINSVLSQTHKNIEFLLVDNNSTDDSAKICKKFTKNSATQKTPHDSTQTTQKTTKNPAQEPTIKLITCKTPGVSAARNLGLKKATGEWIVFLDADDTLAPDFCKKMLSCAKKHSADYVCCGYHRISPSSTASFNATGPDLIFQTRPFAIQLLNPTRGYGFVHMKLIRTSVARSVKFDEKLIVAEDALYNLQLTKFLKKAVILNQPLYNYYITPLSTVHRYSPDYPDIFYHSISAINSYCQKNYPADPALRQAVYNFIAHHLLLVLVNYCSRPENTEPLASLKSILARPLFRSAIEHADFSSFPPAHRITLHLLKHRLHHPALLVGRIRSKKNGHTATTPAAQTKSTPTTPAPIKKQNKENKK